MPVWIEEVHPLDDAELLDKAKPVASSGVKFHAEKLKARQDAQVKTVMAKGGKLAGGDFEPSIVPPSPCLDGS